MPGIDTRITIRDANIDDVAFVAGCVLAAVDLYDFVTASVETATAEKVCAMDDTLYSYRNARVACVDGTPVGCLVSYNGDTYSEARAKTFDIFEKEGHTMPQTDMETCPGEWYLDSMAILPAFRGFGIGKSLMVDGIRLAAKAGVHKVSLIVELSKPKLREYYSELGFSVEKEILAFGDRYFKMSKVI